MYHKVLNFIKKLLRKVKVKAGKKKLDFQAIRFATEQKGVFRVLSFLAILILGAAIPLTVYLTLNVKNVRIKAAGTAIGSKVFCQGKTLCLDGHCEGDTWRECQGCPLGKARAVIEVSCEVYKKSDCVLEAINCVD